MAVAYESNWHSVDADDDDDFLMMAMKHDKQQVYRDYITDNDDDLIAKDQHNDDEMYDRKLKTKDSFNENIICIRMFI